jgi:DNA-binding transcriptional LysR family regulator
MDFQQIKYFITAARCLNFSKAADQLFITQPALSRQIMSIENELNIQLFIRIGHDLKLTPAARVLYAEFSQLYEHYETSVERANKAQRALTGRLSIGVLDGARVDDVFTNILSDFEKNYSEVELVLRYMNLNDLISGLYEGSIDVAFTFFFEVDNRRYIEYKTVAESESVIAMNSAHPLAEKDYVRLGELENETFILLDMNVSERSSRLILDGFSKYGFRPNVRYAHSLYMSALLVQSRLGVTMFDARSIFRFIPGVKCLDTEQIGNPSLVAAWHRDNTNPAFTTFKNYL